MKEQYRNIETKLIHAGEPEQLINGAVSLPIFQSSTFEYSGQSNYHDLKYIRLNNTPNHIALHKKLSALENGEDAIVTASGMGAISSAFLAFLSSGDHFLVQDCMYGGTFDFISKDLSKFGITFDLIDGNDPDSWEDKLKSSTKIIYVETITNPLLEIADHKAVTAFAKKHNIISMIDNTFASPINFRPLEIGFDLSIHSCTKYLNGHSDIVAGAVIGKADLIQKISHKVCHFGSPLDPHACFLLYRGIKTLAVRMRQHNENALKIAEYLENQSKIKKIYFPGLRSCQGHNRAEELFEGFSGMISFELNGGVQAANMLLERVNLPISAPSLGGVETLITRPAVTSHSGLSVEERKSLGISDSLVRLSVGIESADDLIQDLDQALKI